MTSRDFAYWMQGWIEIGDPQSITPEQFAMVKAHLNMVFIHEIDPSFPKEQQKALHDAHAAPRRGGFVAMC